MEISKSIYITDKKEWRSWLKKKGSKEKEIWLVYYRKDSEKPRIPYNDAVNEALCYGWIDSTVKTIDKESFAQRFTPRRPTSHLSEMNKERVRRLIKQRKMTKKGLKAIIHAYDPEENFVIPNYVITELKKDPQVWKNFQNFSEGYKRVRLGYIISQKRHGTQFYKRALTHFIKMTKKNKKFGMIR